MEFDFSLMIEQTGKAVDAAGVTLIVAGGVLAFAIFAWRSARRRAFAEE